MKALGCLILSLTLPFAATAGQTGSLFLKGHVPAQTRVKMDPARGTFSLQSNAGRFSLHTHVREARDERGFRIITVIPQ